MKVVWPTETSMKVRSIFLTAVLLGMSVIVTYSALVVQPTKQAVRPTGDQLGPESSKVEFILFTTDRDNPSILGICRACEEIYMMSAGRLESDPSHIQ